MIAHERLLGRDLGEHPQELAKLGSGSIFTPTGYLAFVFIFFILAVCLFVCAQVAAARHEEAEQQLETLLALPVGRAAVARRTAAARGRRRGRRCR